MIRETSLDAYRALQDHLGEMQQKVLKVIVEHSSPLTDREIAQELGFADPNKVRPRRFELMQAGLIREAGERLCTVSRRRALTWRVLK